jgi:hypothetical protein
MVLKLSTNWPTSSCVVRTARSKERSAATCGGQEHRIRRVMFLVVITARPPQRGSHDHEEDEEGPTTKRCPVRVLVEINQSDVSSILGEHGFDDSPVRRS